MLFSFLFSGLCLFSHIGIRPGNIRCLSAGNFKLHKTVSRARHNLITEKLKFIGSSGAVRPLMTDANSLLCLGGSNKSLLVSVIIVVVDGEFLFCRILKTAAVNLSVIVDGGAFHGSRNVADIPKLLNSFKRQPGNSIIS